MFADGYGSDLVTSFENNDDTLRLNSDLWTGTLTVSQVLDQFATRLTNADFDGVHFDFGGDEIYLNGIGLNALGNDIEIV
ncbi:MAG: hypothetical protein WBC85_04175 [Planktotalea sp.]|uniref:hypothetical protein n=1 Tax=Planktotalea sp. TaxID=2029877 RepID=UPI003C738BEA